jgi:O-antigen ligase
VVLAASVPGLSSVRERVPDEGAGLATLGVLIAVAVLAGGAQWALSRRVSREAGMPRLGRAAAVATAVLAVGAVAATVAANDDAGGARERVDTPRGPERLRTLTTNRRDYWEVALEAVGDEPLRGSGTRAFATVWLERRDIAETTQDAHSLYLETAAELGLPGFLLLACFLAGAAASASRGRRLPAVRGEAAAWIAAGTVFLVHAAFDWDWEMPAVSLVFLALVGASVAAADEEPR